MSGSNGTTVVFRGYTKREDDRWLAICVDLNIAAQADTRDRAEQQCVEMIEEYLDYITTTYPDELDRHVPRFAPDELFAEYDQAVAAAIAARAPHRHGPTLHNFAIDVDPLQKRSA